MANERPNNQHQNWPAAFSGQQKICTAHHDERGAPWQSRWPIRGISISVLEIEVLTDHDVMLLVKQRLKGTTQKQLADKLGVSAAYLNDYLHFRREPGAKLLDGLGLKRVVMYKQKQKS